jgi:hypothetical protein
MTREIIDAIDANDVVALRRAFDDAMVPKVVDAVEIARQELATSIFNDDNEEAEEDVGDVYDNHDDEEFEETDDQDD